MKKLWLILTMAWAALPAFADSSDFGYAKLPDVEMVFSESEMSLPAVPYPNQGEWLKLYVNATHQGDVFILMDSLSMPSDGSVRYILNQRSKMGVDNITAEGLLCSQGLLNSDGASVKTFGYADLHNMRWIEPRRSQWQVIGGKRNAADPVRRVLYEAFCIQHKANNLKNIRETLLKDSSQKHSFDYRK